MALKDDEILEELDAQLAFHCREKNYSCVVAKVIFSTKKSHQLR